MDKRIVANRLTDEDHDFINSGNIDAHGGNARFDATLYSPGGRTDVAVFQQLYGVHPSIIQYVHENVLRLLNIHASDLSSKFKIVTPRYEEYFDTLFLCGKNLASPILTRIIHANCQKHIRASSSVGKAR
jgi:hypothetical protein